MLLTETNTPKVASLIRVEAMSSESLSLHGSNLNTTFEHGQWWLTCADCGAQWSVSDADPGPFDFELVTEGDEDAHRDDL